MLKELQDIGLSEKEARVYLAALEIGKATADQLAKQAKILRPTTYVQLESMMKQGLMSKYEEGKKTYFVPESPEYLKRIFEIKRKEFDVKEKELGNLLPELSQMFESAGERPVVRFFSGKEGITAMREETLSLKKDDEILIIYNFDALVGIYSPEELRSYTDKRVAKGIKVRSIYTKEDKPLEPSDITPNASRRFIPYEKMPIRSDFFIYGDKIAIMALKGHVFGVIVESKEISQSFKILFELIWGIGEKN
jgi:sugar-specific transcriptional regulator TrmB